MTLDQKFYPSSQKKCVQCCLKFYNEEDCIRHISQGCSYKRHECPQCFKSYVHSTDLNRHQKYACGKEPQFFCSMCPFKTYFKNNLKAHINKRHLNVLKVDNTQD